MAVIYAKDLDLPLINEDGAYIDSYDDELGRLDFYSRIDPTKESTWGTEVIDPETGEKVTKTHWFNEDYEDVYVYHIYTESDLEEMRAQEEYSAWVTLLNRSPERIDGLEDTQASADEALCDLYEQLISAQDTIQTQDDAVCELYEMILGTEEV